MAAVDAVDAELGACMCLLFQPWCTAGPALDAEALQPCNERSVNWVVDDMYRTIVHSEASVAPLLCDGAVKTLTGLATGTTY